MNTTTASPKFYIADAGRGYAVIDNDGDGELDWFPTYDEAATRLAELSDPDADR